MYIYICVFYLDYIIHLNTTAFIRLTQIQFILILQVLLYLRDIIHILYDLVLVFLPSMRQYENTDVRQIHQIVSKNNGKHSIYFQVLHKAIIA